MQASCARPAIRSDNGSCKYGAACFELPQTTSALGLDGVERAAQAAHEKGAIGSKSAVGLDR
jgi:hypothetical protein